MVRLFWKLAPCFLCPKVMTTFGQETALDPSLEFAMYKALNSPHKMALPTCLPESVDFIWQTLTNMLFWSSCSTEDSFGLTTAADSRCVIRKDQYQ